MNPIGYHASHEQFTPSELLRCVVDADGAGLQHAMCSGHFAPFSEAQGRSGSARATEEAALTAAHEQRSAGAFAGELMGDIPLPAELDMAARFVRPDDVRDAVRISTDLARQLARVEDDLRLGFDRVYLHQVSRDQQLFLNALKGLKAP